MTKVTVHYGIGKWIHGHGSRACQGLCPRLTHHTGLCIQRKLCNHPSALTALPPPGREPVGWGEAGGLGLSTLGVGEAASLQKHAGLSIFAMHY